MSQHVFDTYLVGSFYHDAAFAAMPNQWAPKCHLSATQAPRLHIYCVLMQCDAIVSQENLPTKWSFSGAEWCKMCLSIMLTRFKRAPLTLIW